MLEVDGNVGAEAPEHKVEAIEKVGTVAELTVTVTDAVFTQVPLFAVKI